MGLASPSHLIIVLVLILLLFGAKKIPELARGLGQGMKEFKAGVNEIGEDDSKDSKKDDSRDRKDENMVNSAASSSTSDSTDERRRDSESV